MVGRIGHLELGRCKREHPRHVERHVAGADHYRVLGLQVDLEPAVVGVTVVPGHELGGGMRPAQVLARNPEPFVDRGTQRVDDHVVVLEQLGTAEVAAELHVPEEAEALVLGGLVIGPRDRLDLRMVRGDPRAHEPVWRRQAVVEVDRKLGLLDGQQLAGRVEAARPGADDCDAKRRLVGHA